MKVFSTEEFVKMAIKDEETGIAFYTALAETTQNEVLKQNYYRLADQEKHHAENFKKMLDNVEPGHVFEQRPGQYEDFVDAMLETRAFSTPEKAAEEAKKLSAQDAVQTALKMEKDTLIFYLDMKDYIPDKHKSYIEEIITEERGHIRDLAALREQIK